MNKSWIRSNWKRLFHLLSLVIIIELGILSSLFLDNPQGNLSTIATSLSAILAIVFSISLLAVQIVSDKYTPRVLDYFKKDWLTYITLIIFLLTITLCILFVGISYLCQGFYAICFVLFLVCCYVFVNYFYKMLKIINPIELADLLQNEGAKSIKKVDTEEVENVIDSLGDIAIKTIQRNEETVTKKYIQTLYDIFDEFLKLREVNPEKYKPMVNRNHYNDNVLGYVLDQYFRIYKEAVFRKDSTITKEISDKLFVILNKCITGKDNDILIQQIIDTKRIHGAKYYQFCKVAIENKDFSRFFLIQNLSSILQIYQYQSDKIEDKWMEEFITSHLFRTNQLIIDCNDFELFMEEIDNFSRILSIKSPSELQNDIGNDLYLADVLPVNLYQNEDIFREIERKRKYLQFIVRYNISRDFEAKNVFGKRLEEFKNFIIGHIENENNIKEKIDGIKHELCKLYISSKIHKTFFVVGAYILFKGEEGKIDAGKYLEELWEHTHPEDADIKFLNESPITFNSFWLTYLLFYGGENSGIWFDDFTFEGFHGVTDYIYQYYLLCIAKSIEKGKDNLGLPQRNDLERMVEENKTYELEELYQFSNEFELEAEDLIKYCDGLIKESDNWDVLLGNNAKEALEKTKEWINMTLKECKRVKKEIEVILPLHSKKVAKCREDILETYKESSKIPEVVQVREFDEERDKELEFISIDIGRKLIPKDFLIKPSYGIFICSDYGRYVTIREINYLIEQILEDERIERIKIKEGEIEEIFEKIKSVVNSLKKQNYTPSVIFIPLEILTEFVKKRLIKTFEYLKIDENTELKVINSSLIPFEDIIILDKAAGIWTFKPDEETRERLIIEIKEYEKDKSKADVLVKTVINYQIKNSSAIKILKVVKK